VCVCVCVCVCVLRRFHVTSLYKCAEIYVLTVRRVDSETINKLIVCY